MQYITGVETWWNLCRSTLKYQLFSQYGELDCQTVAYMLMQQTRSTGRVSRHTLQPCFLRSTNRATCSSSVTSYLLTLSVSPSVSQIHNRTDTESKDASVRWEFFRWHTPKALLAACFTSCICSPQRFLTSFFWLMKNLLIIKCKINRSTKKKI